MRITLLSRGPPKLSAMAAVKYAPPAMPPRKKYQTMSRCQSGDLSIAAVLGGATALAEGHERAHPHQERRAHREERIHLHVALGQERLLWELVGRRPVEEQEEGVETSQRPVRVGAVQLRVLVAQLLEGGHALLRLGHELVAEAELDGVGGTGLGARGSEPVVDPVVAERALVRAPRVMVEGDHAERAGADAVPAAVAHVLVDVDGAELRAIDRPRRAGVEAAGLGAVLADVRHEEPGELTVGLGLLHEADEAVCLVRKGRVVLVGAGPLGLLAGQLVPLLAGDLAGATADAQRGVREHRQRAGHGYTSPFLTLHMKAFVSWMYTVGSATVAERSLVMSPLAMPLYPQCHGTPIWWTVLPSIMNGLSRCVTMALATIFPRGVDTVTLSPLAMPSSLASSWLISVKCDSKSSASIGRYRDMTPERWCSVSRYVVMTYGYSLEPTEARSFF